METMEGNRLFRNMAHFPEKYGLCFFRMPHFQMLQDAIPTKFERIQYSLGTAFERHNFYLDFLFESELQFVEKLLWL